LQVAELKNFLFKPAAVGTTADHNLKKTFSKSSSIRDNRGRSSVSDRHLQKTTVLIVCGYKLLDDSEGL